jgi:hypothetical protein
VLELIITGGQTGADQAAWRAARACGLCTSGMMPKGYRTLDGDHPEFAGLYGATEHETSRDWAPRTEDNIVGSYATLIFNRGQSDSAGTQLARRLCLEHKKPHMVVDPENPPPELYVAGRIAHSGHRILNVAGNRVPDPDTWVEAYLTTVFALLVLQADALAKPPWPGVEAVLCEMSRLAGPAAAAAALRGDYKARPR